MGCNPIPPSYGLLPLYGFHPLLSTMVSRGVFKMRAQGFVVLLYVFSLVHLSVGQLVIICYYIIWVYLDLICFPVKQKQESFCSVSLLTNQRENQTGNQTTYTAKVWKGKTTSFRKFQELSKTTMQNRSVRVLNSGRCVAFSRPGLDHDLLRDASVMWTKTANTEEKARASKEKAGCEACNRIWYGKLCGYLISRLHASVILLMRFFIVSWPFMVRLLCCDLWLFVADATWKKTMTGKKKTNETFDDEQRILFYLFIISQIPADKALTILRITCC